MQHLEYSPRNVISALVECAIETPLVPTPIEVYRSALRGDRDEFIANIMLWAGGAVYWTNTEPDALSDAERVAFARGDQELATWLIYAPTAFLAYACLEDWGRGEHLADDLERQFHGPRACSWPFAYQLRGLDCHRLRDAGAGIIPAVLLSMPGLTVASLVRIIRCLTSDSADLLLLLADEVPQLTGREICWARPGRLTRGVSFEGEPELSGDLVSAAYPLRVMSTVVHLWRWFDAEQKRATIRLLAVTAALVAGYCSDQGGDTDAQERFDRDAGVFARAVGVVNDLSCSIYRDGRLTQAASVTNHASEHRDHLNDICVQWDGTLLWYPRTEFIWLCDQDGMSDFGRRAPVIPLRWVNRAAVPESDWGHPDGRIYEPTSSGDHECFLVLGRIGWVVVKAYLPIDNPFRRIADVAVSDE